MNASTASKLGWDHECFSISTFASKELTGILRMGKKEHNSNGISKIILLELFLGERTGDSAPHGCVWSVTNLSICLVMLCSRKGCRSTHLCS